MATKVKKTNARRSAAKKPLAPKRKQAKRQPGTSTMSTKNQITIPSEIVKSLGLMPGDRVEFKRTPTGTIELELAGLTRSERIERGAGIFDGMYPENYLEELRRNDW